MGNWLMEDRAATFRKQSIAARLVPVLNEERAFRVKVPHSIGSIPSCLFADIEAVKVGQLQALHHLPSSVSVSVSCRRDPAIGRMSIVQWIALNG